MKPTKTSVHHYFHIDRDPTWPDLPWPGWKPETKKMYRPMRVSFKIHIEDGKVGVSNPIASGPRINSGGTLGADNTETYYLTEKRTPPFIRALVDEAKRCVEGLSIIPGAADFRPRTPQIIPVKPHHSH